MKRYIVLGLALSAALAGRSLYAQQYVTSTVAGLGGSVGYSGDGGPAISAQLSNPLCVAVDSGGNYYVADWANYVVRKIAAGTGMISTVAGNGTPGYSGDGGPAVAAQISTVHGLAVDSKGNLYIADTVNSRVRVVDVNGNISTMAGNGTRGYSGDNGYAPYAQLAWPAGLAVDRGGNLYIADFGNGTVRKVAPSGIITTAAGIGVIGFGGIFGEGGYAIYAALQQPYSVALDETGNLFIGDVGSSSILKVGKDGILHTFVPRISTASLAADPAGNLYFGDYRASTINKVLTNGTVITVAGNGTRSYNGDGGPGNFSEFNLPYSVAIDSSANLYVADYANNVIRLLSPLPASNLIVANGASNVGFTFNALGVRNIPYPIAPGEILTLFGTALGPTAQAQPDANGFIATQLGGVSVTFNGVAAPILSTSPSQVVVVAPYALNGSAQANIVVSSQGKNAATATVPVAATEPEIFGASSAASAGISFAGSPVLNADGTVNSTSNAAAEGSTISLFVTGAGMASPAVTGRIAADSSIQPLLPVTVFIKGENATVVSVGSVAGQLTGVTQINVTIPSDVTTNSFVPVSVQVGTAQSIPVSFAVQ